MHSSCQILPSASFISLFSSTSFCGDVPFPAFPFFPFTGFSFLFSNFCPSFLVCSLLPLPFLSMPLFFSISLLPLLNTPSLYTSLNIPLLLIIFTSHPTFSLPSPLLLLLLLLLLLFCLQHWLTELEIFAMIFAAAVHDYEHTGTTNNFHIQTRSDTAILYNDRSVLESHHVSAAYRLLQDDDEMNILYNLSKDDWRELRALVVEMVLATDMSCHFQQVKAMKNFLQQPEGIDKPKALSLLLHTADISHPAKSWDLHHRWTTSLLEEFFRQGDKESELGLPFSPLCDRKSTMVAQSQIGFIDFIVVPTFTVLTDMMERIVKPLIDEASHSGFTGFRRSSLNSISSEETKRQSVKSSDSSTSGHSSLLTVDLKNFKALWNEEVYQNRERWKTQATKEAEERAKREAEEKAQQEEAMEPQEVNAEPEQPEPKEDQTEEEEPESAEATRPPDGNTEEVEQEAQPESDTHKNPPLQNGELSEGTESPEGEENKNKGDDEVAME
ncbi:hypothetical protein ABVT39_003904 [Epinephelus coioides]